jgi:asparagine synthetase B (glutamine-hydrolysing)
LGFYRQYWDELYPSLGPAGKYWLDLAHIFSGHNCLISRNGDWVSPWPFAVVPGFEMPKFEPHFSESFSDITDRRALEIRDLLRKTGAQVALYYSGGIDSTICLAALLRNLNAEELKNIHVCMSAESIQENPSFFEKFIYRKMNINLPSMPSQFAKLIHLIRYNSIEWRFHGHIP